MRHCIFGFKNQNPNAHLYSNDNAILTNINDQYDDDDDDIRILLLDGSQGLLLSTPLRLSDIDSERFTNGTSKALFFSTQNLLNDIGWLTLQKHTTCTNFAFVLCCKYTLK